MNRLVEACRAYIEAVCREAELRERGEILGLEEYRLLRRENIALRLCFSLFEYCFGFDLPDEVGVRFASNEFADLILMI